MGATAWCKRIVEYSQYFWFALLTSPPFLPPLLSRAALLPIARPAQRRATDAADAVPLANAGTQLRLVYTGADELAGRAAAAQQQQQRGRRASASEASDGGDSFSEVDASGLPVTRSGRSASLDSGGSGGGGAVREQSFLARLPSQRARYGSIPLAVDEGSDDEDAGAGGGVGGSSDGSVETLRLPGLPSSAAAGGAPRAILPPEGSGSAAKAPAPANLWGSLFGGGGAPAAASAVARVAPPATTPGRPPMPPMTPGRAGASSSNKSSFAAPASLPGAAGGVAPRRLLQVRLDDGACYRCGLMMEPATGAA